MITTGSEVDDFDILKCFIGKQNVFRLHVAVNYRFVFHVLQALKHLERDSAQLLGFKYVLLSLVALHKLVQVELELLENNNHMLSKLEAVEN